MTDSIPEVLCQCGCGRQTVVMSQTSAKQGRVKGQPNRYIRGHCHPVRDPAERFWSHVDRSDSNGCWEWRACLHKDGYGSFGLFSPRRRSVLAHRFSWELHRGPIPDRLCVLHDCPGGDNPACVNPAHLWIGTDEDNNHDKELKGRANHATGASNGACVHPERLARGEDNPNAVLTDELVREIRDRAARGEAVRPMARALRIERSTVRNVVLRRTWKHVA